MIVKDLDLTGKTISNYKVIGRLGKGGMATVYKAHELSLNRMVALKVLSPQLSEDTDFIKRFQREAQAAAQLNHPNIVQIYAIGEEEGIHYFAMEYIKGEPLSDLKKKEGLLHPVRALTIIKQSADGLAEAHKAGLVHRDIKPCNIMIDSLGRAKVTDFGIAYVSHAQTKLTREGSIIGTPEYLSPEQCEGKKVDGRSDIYSLGVSFYEILTGRTPYEADTPVSMLMKILKGNFLPIEQVNPAVPIVVQDVVKKMMQTKPDDRYADVAELLDALREAEGILGAEISDSQVNDKESNAKQSVDTGAKPAAPSVEDENAVTATIQRDVPGKENPITATIQREYPKIEDGTPEQTPAPPGETAQPEGASEPVDYAEPVEYAAPVKKSRAAGLIAAVIVVLLMGGAFAAKVLYFDKKTDPKPAVTETKETTGTATSSNADTPKEGETTDASESGETQTPTTAGDTPGTESAGTGNATAGDETTDTEGETAGDETAGTEVESTGTEVETATDTPPQTAQSGESTAVASKLTPSKSTPPATPVESADTTAAPAASKTNAKNNGPRVAHKAPASRGPSSTTSTTSTTPTGNKIRFSTDGSSDNAELVTDYVRKIFSENKFKLVSRSGNAGYRMVVKVSQMSSVTKEFYGRSSVTQRVNVTVSAISLQNGETIAITGPTVIEYTSLNEEENLQEAAKRLTYKMLDKLKNQ